MWVRTDVCAALCDRHRGRGPSAQVPPIKETGGVGVTKRPWRAGIEVIEVEPRWNRGGIEVEPARGEPLRTRIRSSARLRAPPPSYLHILSQSPHSDVSLLSPTLFLLRQFSLSILRKITSGRWGGGTGGHLRLYSTLDTLGHSITHPMGPHRGDVALVAYDTFE